MSTKFYWTENKPRKSMDSSQINCIPPKVCFDFNGQIANNSPFCPDVNSFNRCISGRPRVFPEFTLMGPPATSVNQTMNIPGFGGIQTSGGSPIFNITDLRNLSPYVVGTNPGDSEYTSVQAAVDQAVADGVSSTNQQVGGTAMGNYRRGFPVSNVASITSTISAGITLEPLTTI